MSAVCLLARPLSRLFTSLSLVLLMTGCSREEGSGYLVGSLRVERCDDETPLDARCLDGDLLSCEAFDLGADFFALELGGDQATLRVQRGGKPFGQGDGLLLDIRDVRAIRGHLGEPLPVSPTTGIRAALGLFQRCPDANVSFELQGEVVFDRFGVDKGDRISGRVLWLEIRDARDPEAAALGVLHGEFDFERRRGAPFEFFPGGP